MLENKFEDSIWKVIVSFWLFGISGVVLIFSLLPLNLAFRFPSFVPYLTGAVMCLCVWYGVWALNKRAFQYDSKLLSSRLTPFYRFFIPLILLVVFVAVTLLLVLEWNVPQHFFPLVIVDAIVVVLAYPTYRLCRLNVVYSVSNFVIVSNFFKEETFSVLAIISLRNYLPGIYRLQVDKYLVCENYLFIPSISEQLARLCRVINITEVEKFVRGLRPFEPRGRVYQS